MKKSNLTRKSLRLSKQTVRTLSQKTLRRVAGGAPTNQDCNPTQQESMCVC